MHSTESSNMLDFLLLVAYSKNWVGPQKVPDPECVAGHMHRMAIMTLLLDSSQTSLDKTRCMQLALIHDLAECIVGDITPHCGIDPEEKHRRENEAMKTLSNLAGTNGPNLYSLYQEYEAKSSPEAKFVKELDNFDMILEAYSYENDQNRSGSLQEFFDSTQNKFSHPLVLSLVQELSRRREELALSTCSSIASTDT